MSDESTTIRVIAFPGAPNLPTFAAIEHGFFAGEGFEVELALTGSSIEQAERTANGEFDIIFTAFDNVVAYCEGQGAAGPGVDPGYVVIMGATQLELSLVVDPSIKAFEDLKGKTLALDALSTGFAFVLKEMLARAGLSQSDTEFVAVGATPQRWQSVKNGEHAGTLTIEPFTTLAVNSGCHVLNASTGLFASYQGGVVAARRQFILESPDKTRAFIRGYLRGLDWALDPANREAAESLLQSRMPEIKPQGMKAVIKSVMSPASGLTPEAQILPDGMQTVLDLRSRYGSGSEALSDPERYLDLSCYHAVTGKA